MTDDQAKNVLLEFCKEKLNLVKLFRWNASMKHGVPIDDTTKLSINNTISPEKKPVSSTQSSVTSPLGIYAFIVSLLLATLGGIALANYLKEDTTKPVTNVTNVGNGEDSALQWLEDNGEHLP